MWRFPLKPLSDVLKYEKEAEEKHVSEVARSENGFLTAYKKYGRAIENNEFWMRKRYAFISRVLPEYEKKPTRRRLLSLYMWAFNPHEKYYSKPEWLDY